jgi:hypothetical protein
VFSRLLLVRVRIRGQVIFCLFIADVGFTVGKLFPVTYLCRTLDCAKITHNCVMTLSSFIFAAFECMLLAVMAKDQSEGEGQGKGSTSMVKFLELALSLAYVLYDFATTEPPGVGTTVLIVVTCLAEVLLLCVEGYTIYKYDIQKRQRGQQSSLQNIAGPQESRP